MNEFYQEVTEWKVPTPNHIYLLNENKTKMIGYVKNKSNSLELFKKPLPFSTTRRKFKQIPNTFGYVNEPIDLNRIAVQGSKGNTYYLSNDNGIWSCTCSGFKFRGSCKHTKVQNQ